MKKIISTIITSILLSSTIVMGQSTTDLLNETIDLDKKLNTKYHKLREYLNDDDFTKLKSAQIDWIKFKEKTCRFENTIQKYDKNWIAESVSGEQNLECIQRLTKHRLGDLTNYISKTKQTKITVENCQFKNLPDKFEVYAVGKYSGIKSSDIQIGESGNSTKEIEVVVNKPGTPIVLILMAYDPVIWKVSHTDESNILAVVLGGYHTQALVGLPTDTPQINAVYEEKSKCKYFYAYKVGRKFDNVIDRIKGITGKDLNQFVTTPIENKFYIGRSDNINSTRLIFSNDTSLSDIKNVVNFPAGQRGLDKLVELGKIRLASQAEIDSWVDQASTKYQKYQNGNKGLKVSHNMHVGRTYVVLDNFKMPNGLAGGHSRSFIVPSSQSLPTGPRGHCTFYLMSAGKCTGPDPECRR